MRSRGVLYMAISALGFSVMGALVKLASRTIPTGEVVLARAVVTLALSYVMVRRAGVSPWGHAKRKLLLRGALGFSALGCYYISIAALPLADAITLQNTAPLITGVLAWWLLREPLGWSAGVALACGLAGVLLIVHPAVPLGGGADAGGVAIAVAGATLAALAYVTVRGLAATEQPIVIVFYFPLVATPLAIPWAAAHFVWPTPVEWLMLLGIGVATQVGQVFMTLSLAVEKAGRASSVAYLQVAFAMVWQLVVFGQQPAFGTIAGAALIICGTLAVSATTRREPPPPRTAT